MSSIRTQLLLILLLAGLAPAMLSVLGNVTLTTNTVLKSSHASLRAFGEEVAREIRATADQAANALRSISTNPTLTDPQATQEEQATEFDRLTTYNPIFADITLATTNGFTLFCTNAADLGQRNQTTQFYQALSSGQGVVSLPEIDLVAKRQSGKTHLRFDVYEPVKSASGSIVSVVKATVRFDRVWDILRKAKFGSTGSLVLLDGMGNVLFHEEEQKILTNYVRDTGVNFNSLESGEYAALNGAAVLFETIRLTPEQTHTPRGWNLISRMERPESLVVAEQSRRYTLIGALVAVVGGAILGHFLSDYLARPVIRAARAARQVAEGDLAVRLKVEGPEEMRILATSFNEMTDQVQAHHEDLEMLVQNRTKRLQESQDSLSEIHAQLRAAYESTREAILVLNNEGFVLAANRRMEEVFGLNIDEIHGQSLHRFLKHLFAGFAEPAQFEETWTNCQNQLESTGESEWEILKPVQRTISAYTAPVRNDSGQVIARLWMFRDISENRQLEKSLRQSQKMEAIGRLAGGVAHDFNNLLMGILGNLALVDQEGSTAANAEVSRCLQSARTAGQRAAELVKGLLGFSRQSHLKLAACRVINVIHEVENLVRHTFDRRIQIALDLAEETWPVMADANQIEQVVMNMMVNAKDALPVGGCITLSTSNVAITPEQAERMQGAKGGQFVRISVTDDGHGMSEDVKSKIFEPFFTTKEQGKGTGLGLATSFGIVQQHGGWITCDSLPGKGTTFHIFLPRHEGPEEVLVPGVAPAAARGGGETILLVDDEVVVRAVAESVLKKLGYRIVTASDGEEALEMLARLDGAIDLVMMDMTMPRLSGKDTFRAMRHGLARNIPVLICSGYLMDTEDFEAETGSVPNGFLQKPYDVQEMARSIRQVLDDSKARKHLAGAE